MVDLHLHTTYSDGNFTPKEILEMCKVAGLELFSITDHDNVKANKEILDELKTKNHNIKYLIGTEITSTFKNVDIHLCCYDFDLESIEIHDIIAKTIVLRKQRIKHIAAHLAKAHGIKIPDDKVNDLLDKTNVPGQPHIAELAMRLGLTNLSISDFIKEYIQDKKIQIAWIPAEDVIKAIHDAGGFVSLAHPFEYDKKVPDMDKFIGELKQVGLDAVEVFCPSHDAEAIDAYTRITQKYSLKTTAGSDFHGYHPTIKIGKVTKS